MEQREHLARIESALVKTIVMREHQTGPHRADPEQAQPRQGFAAFALEHVPIPCARRVDFRQPHDVEHRARRRIAGSGVTIAQAAEAYDLGEGDWQVFASAALAYAAPGLREVAVQNHRALGAIGYAEEHEAPRHFRRVHTDVGRFGGATRARAELADYLLGRKA